jgi:DNA-directed RNA polymerase subunit alpha
MNSLYLEMREQTKLLKQIAQGVALLALTRVPVTSPDLPRPKIKPPKAIPPPKEYAIDISVLKLSTRTRKALWRKNIQTIGELCQLTAEDLMSIRNFGKVSLNEVKQKLSAFGLSLKKTP